MGQMSESILCLDPSSSACGVAYFPTLGYRQHPTYVHVIRPKGIHKTSIARIDYIVGCVLETAREWKPSVVVLEYSAGKVAGRLQAKKMRKDVVTDLRRLGVKISPELAIDDDDDIRNISGLAVMGQAQGEVRRVLLCHGFDVQAVDESWTGRVSKVERAAVIDVTIPAYREFREGVGDPGYDAADAIGIGLYYIGKMQQEGMVERGNRL